MGVDYNYELVIGCQIDLDKLKKFIIDFEKKKEGEEEVDYDLEIDLYTFKEITGKDLFIKKSGSYYSKEPFEYYLTLNKKNTLTLSEIQELLSNKELINDLKSFSELLISDEIIITSIMMIS